VQHVQICAMLSLVYAQTASIKSDRDRNLHKRVCVGLKAWTKLIDLAYSET